jgi:hypothetical protein
MISKLFINKLEELEKKGIRFLDTPIDKTIFIIVNSEELRVPNDIRSINKCIRKTKDYYYEELFKLPEGDPNCPNYNKNKSNPKIYVLLEVEPPTLNTNSSFNKKEVD